MSETLQGLSAYLRAQAVALDAIPRQAFGGEAARSAKTLRDWADGVDALVASSTPEPELFDQAWPMPAKTGSVITEAGRHSMQKAFEQARWPMPFKLAADIAQAQATAGEGTVAVECSPLPQSSPALSLRVMGQLKDALDDVLAKQDAPQRMAT